MPEHSHPGDGIVHVIEDVLEYQVGDEPPLTVAAGEVLFIPAEVIHTVKNIGSGNAAKPATCVAEKGKAARLLAK